ncbi:hypothetical protein D3C72_2394920 [compost metagenome]
MVVTTSSRSARPAWSRVISRAITAARSWRSAGISVSMLSKASQSANAVISAKSKQ